MPPDDLSIMQISAEYPPDPGGVGDYTHLLSRALIACGHHVSVVTGPRPAATAEGEPRHHVVRGGWGWHILPALASLIAREQPAIVHIQYQTGAFGMHPAITLLPRWLRRMRHRPRVVVTAHDLRLPYLLPKAGLLRRWVTRRLVADADAVIVTNAADQARLAGHGADDPEIFRAHRPISSTVIPIGSNITPHPPADYIRAAWRMQHGIDPDES